MAEYCAPADLGIYGVNAEAISDLSVEEKVLPAIVVASAEIDSYLRGSGRYTLPLTAVGDDVKDAAAVLAAWRVLQVRGLKPGENPEDNALMVEVNRVRKWLAQIASGSVSPNVTDSTPSPTAEGWEGVGQITSNEQRGTFNSYGGGYAFQGRRQS
jgi:phage gp36-like protein